MLVISTQSLDVLVISNTKPITITTIIHHVLIRIIIVDNHMDVIPIQIGRNIVEHVLINGGCPNLNLLHLITNYTMTKPLGMIRNIICLK
jgi:hypothetical protein